MFDRILVPLDGSELAAAILSQARRLLFHRDIEILLVRAFSVPPSAEAAAVGMAGLLEAHASTYLEGVAGTLGLQGARVRTVTREGNAAEVILDVAEEEKASLIALSTHGRSGLARWALGSIAEKILRASRVPVLAVRSFIGSKVGARRTDSAELGLKKILVPIDASGISPEVVRPALELARRFGSKVILLHVCEGQECSVPVPTISAAYEEFRIAGVSVEPLMKMGDPAREILEVCRVEKADLIAMTTHSRAGVSRWMMGSVTEKVLHASTVPLLVVRPSRSGADQKIAPGAMQGSKA